MDKKELDFILKEGEGQFIEFKKTFNDEVIESLIAFANSKGGRVIVGINDSKKLEGVNINGEILKNWINEIKTKTFRELLPSARIEKIDGRNIVIFEVLENQMKPVSFKGRYFIRKAGSNHLMDATEISKEIINSKNKSFDSLLVEGYSIEDLNVGQINNVIDLINRRKEIKIDKDINKFLVKYNLIIDHKPTLAALLLFSEKYSNKRIVQSAIFQSTLIIKDELVCDSYLALQVNELFEFIKKHISKMTFITTSPENIQKWEYPLEALRELLINLVVHRDYSETATIKIFDDKIIFSNYGGLPEEYSVLDFIEGRRSSYIRNKLIARVFKDAGIIEEYSSGLNRVVNFCSRNGNSPPEFQVDTHNFTVTLKSLNQKNAPVNAPVNASVKLNKVQIKIIEKIKLNPDIQYDLLAESLQVDRTTIMRNISKLKQKGLLKRVGPDKGGHWEVL